MSKSLVAAAILAAGILPASATTLTGVLSADDAFFAYISTDDAVRGTLIGQGDGLAIPLPPLTPTGLTPGTTYFLHIMAQNGGGDGRLLGQFSLSDSSLVFANGATTLSTDVTGPWRGGYVAPFIFFGPAEQPWVKPAGAVNAGLSGYVLGSIWPSDALSYPSGPCQGCTVAYSTTITTASAVPEPVSLALLGAGLLGLGLVRRRA